MDGEINKELVFSYFAGRVTVFQKQMIDDWAREAVNRELFFKWLHEWELSNLQFTSDIDLAIEKHWELMHYHGLPAESHEDEPVTRKKDRSGRITRLVAAAVVLFVTSLGILKKDLLLFRAFQTDFSETSQIDLPDGSKVVLNANSRLLVPRFGFGNSTREVMLEGEADFDVSHTADNRRFIVKTKKGIEVVVLGTVFNVYARPRGTKVVLNEGSVQLNYHEGEKPKQLLMTPGDLVTVDDEGHTRVSKTENPEKFSAWKSQKFVFEETPLYEIGNLFQDNFGLNVQIPDSNLANLTVSGSFPAKNAQELLSILSEGSGLHFRQSENGTVIISVE